MKRGWTIAELLVSVSLLGVLMLLLSGLLQAAQRSLLAASRQATAARVQTDLHQVLNQDLSQIRLTTYPTYDAARREPSPVLASDLHFVCGPSERLLGAIPGIVGDAVFFQRPAIENGLLETLQACGFFLRYGDDLRWRPAYLQALPPHRRFRLHRFQQSMEETPLFRAEAAPANLSTARQRELLYAWFSIPLSKPSTQAVTTSIVAENVVALLITPESPGTEEYDSRRYQWDDSAEALASRHTLPPRLDITLLVVDEVAWARLSPARADQLAARLTQLMREARQRGSGATALRPLTDLLQSQGLSFHVSVLTIPLLGS